VLKAREPVLQGQASRPEKTEIAFSIPGLLDLWDDSFLFQSHSKAFKAIQSDSKRFKAIQRSGIKKYIFYLLWDRSFFVVWLLDLLWSLGFGGSPR
jgi:hypothetical protein